MAIQNPNTLSPREYELQQYEKEMWEKQSAHQLAMKRLDIEVLKTEARFNSWFKIPQTIIKLPVLIIMAVGYCIAIARKHEPSESYWKLMK